MFLVKSSFMNGEKPLKAGNGRAKIWHVGMEYKGEQSEQLLAAGLIEKVNPADKAADAGDAGDVPPAPKTEAELKAEAKAAAKADKEAAKAAKAAAKN